jgi:hypothetical protein
MSLRRQDVDLRREVSDPNRTRQPVGTVIAVPTRIVRSQPWVVVRTAPDRTRCHPDQSGCDRSTGARAPPPDWPLGRAPGPPCPSRPSTAWRPPSDRRRTPRVLPGSHDHPRHRRENPAAQDRRPEPGHDRSEDGLGDSRAGAGRVCEENRQRDDERQHPRRRAAPKQAQPEQLRLATRPGDHECLGHGDGHESPRHLDCLEVGLYRRHSAPQQRAGTPCPPAPGPP